MPAILTNSMYSPARGGHAPGDLRDAFLEAVDAFMSWSDGVPEPTVDLRGQALPLSHVCGLVWNCRDIIPGFYWDWIQDLVSTCEPGPARRTYAACARWLKHRIETLE